MKPNLLSLTIASVLFSGPAIAEVTPESLPTLLVNADFRPAEAQDIPVSLTTFDDEIIESRGAQHIEDLLNLAPNVNISSGASRGQYFQIRGIGERSEFKAPLNPSVGLYIDGIDFSRTGGAATLFDIEQVEVLRGPQGTLYGANGMAGTINLKSKEATEDFDLRFESTLADYDTRAVGIAVGGPIVKDRLLGRISVYQNNSDGYMDNDFLNRDNTQNRDELTTRAHLKWLATSDLTIDLNLLHLNIDNGYDAFTFDNSRNSLSDQPGEDSQHTNALSLKADYRVNDAVQLQSNMTYSKSDLVYSYDDDWSYKSQFPLAPECVDADDDNDPYTCPYSGFDEYKRERENYSFELRALSNENGRIFADTTDWTIGFYIADQRQDLKRTYFANDIESPAFTPYKESNTYETLNTAIYGQLDTAITQKLTLITGLRAEYWTADYDASNNISDDPNEMMYGGKVGLKYQFNDDHLAFTTLSRGYKAGGINVDPRVIESNRSFESEYLWNLEAGLKSFWLDGDLITSLTAFYTLRKDAQIKSSLQVPRDGGGTDFIDYFVNAEKVSNVGIEAELDWLVNNNVRLFASLGLLDATLNDYENPELLDEGITLSGRRIAHAPSYQFSLGGDYYITNNWTLSANVEGKDEFYFSNSHNAKSGSYALVNASLQYARNNWKFTLWGRNLFDKDYYTRGFFWGIDPSAGEGYEDRKYVQLGDPRVIGMTVSYDY
ncbi:TonB-dependent receptor [Methylophaga sp. OBS3]|uniref:TonB-dependent receptor n=1 Tax=Methylophaga sp. OBS3 TaxID=2991934 RepID=UPI00224D92C9|nr:TonB-dependent receptor [Methylophaga sp. OBS3]MCX4190387.1 TonB-dependent receptor [Methylophaga sp. OBS3]